MIDLRSDTITQPTLAMRKAIADADVGDDVFGDDPTVEALEQATAELLGKEAAVFVPSGTMANQIAIRSHTQAGDEIIIDANAHVYYYEAGGTAALSGVICRTLPGERGVFTAEQLEAALRPIDQHFAPTRVVCLENTHNRGGGHVWPMASLTGVTDLARSRGLALHLDGARLWNATAATGISEQSYASNFDSVSVCFSKGLGAPVGSVLVGTEAFIARARRFRKQFGGGMRQAGMMAAGALFALQEHRERLLDDHANAKRFAQGLLSVRGIAIDLDEVETNIVRFRCESLPASELQDRLESLGVRLLAIGPGTCRAVTSLMVDAADMDQAIACVQKAMTE